MEERAFWKGVIREQYGEQEEGLCTHDMRGRFGLGFWKAIFSSWRLLASSCLLRLEMVRRLSFGQTLGLRPPCYVSFPLLYVMAALKEGWTRGYWSGSASGNGWFPVFIRPFND